MLRWWCVQAELSNDWSRLVSWAPTLAYTINAKVCPLWSILRRSIICSIANVPSVNAFSKRVTLLINSQRSRSVLINCSRVRKVEKCVGEDDYQHWHHSKLCLLGIFRKNLLQNRQNEVNCQVVAGEASFQVAKRVEHNSLQWQEASAFFKS